MQLRVHGRLPAVLEQVREVGGDAPEEGLDRALDLEIARGRMTEQRPVVDERRDQIEEQAQIDVVAQITPRERPTTTPHENKLAFMQAPDGVRIEILQRDTP